MRERVSLLGGILEARREADLFRVRARIPYDGVEEQA
jgi:signal transduction histidine kinase